MGPSKINMSQFSTTLSECGIQVNRAEFLCMDEASQLAVTDSALTGMMKFITDKYNSLDFAEIEKSAGDITRFKYYQTIRENAEMLRGIYQNSEDPGAEKYVRVANDISNVLDFLAGERGRISAHYKAGNGMIQIMYTSMVAACIYSTGTLVSNTIRFVTTEQDTDCTVLFEEIPGTIKHVHIKNIISTENSLSDFSKLLYTMENQARSTDMKAANESVTAGSIVAGIAIFGGVIYMIPKIIMLIREIIYSIYYSRVRMSEMLGVQVDLIRTNIESLEAGRGNKKIIVRQKKIADKLERWKNRVAVKIDSTNAAVKMQMQKENSSLHIDKSSPLVDTEGTTAGLMI